VLPTVKHVPAQVLALAIVASKGLILMLQFVPLAAVHVLLVMDQPQAVLVAHLANLL